MNYNYSEIEKKWSEKWLKDKTFTVNLSKADNPYYALFMFPYPSAEGLHIGNFYAFICIDIIAKYKKLKGFDVFQPFGFDAFGIHSENYALKINQSPREMLNRTENNFRKQMISAGLGCDWTREINTTHHVYYKWTQWIFLKLFEKKLAFQKQALLNWCPGCKTVLADEQIQDGLCERCSCVPKKKNLKQWFFKITDYSQRLLDGLDSMDWSEITKLAQKNWIGRSEGAEIDFLINDHKVTVFTTRADTLFGATYFVLSPEHSLVNEITKKEYKKQVNEYVEKSGAKSDLERIESKQKTGVFTGSYAINPINNKKIPVWIADYVLMGYGTGAIMAVPAHDERDFDFAKKYKIEIKEVIKPINNSDKKEAVFVDDGVLINSQEYNDLSSQKARDKIHSWLEENKIGRKKINYKLRDWCISRQRYWGPPIPVIHCQKCGVVPVKEQELPVKLPVIDKNWQPSGDGKGPLAKIKDFVEVNCPQCNEKAQRETDVMDNFLDSAWYFFRYLSPDNEKEIFTKKIGDKWLPVDIYIGGNEHAVLHLMYTRFITMFFHDLKLINFDNPFKVFRANGMILKDGKKMSKSKGNVVNPEDYGQKIGYDALKSYLFFLGPLDENKSFSDSGIYGTKRWIEKIVRLEDKVKKEFNDNLEIVNKINDTIKKIEQEIESQKYNTAVAHLMKLTNALTKQKNISQKVWLKFIAIIAPFTPALAEEMWFRSGNEKSIFSGKNWPDFDKQFSEKQLIKIIIQINGKTRSVVEADKGLSEQQVKDIALSDNKIKKWIEDKKINKVIFVKDKLINICT